MRNSEIVINRRLQSPLSQIGLQKSCLFYHLFSNCFSKSRKRISHSHPEIKIKSSTGPEFCFFQVKDILDMGGISIDETENALNCIQLRWQRSSEKDVMFPTSRSTYRYLWRVFVVQCLLQRRHQYCLLIRPYVWRDPTHIISWTWRPEAKAVSRQTAL